MRKRRAPMRKKSTKRRRKTVAKPRHTTNRVTAIQRAAFTPKSRIVEFVHDETYYVHPNGVKGANSCGLRFNLSNPYATAANGILSVPWWGAIDTNASTNMSGTAFESPPPGWSRWLGFGDSGIPAPYRQVIVLGADYTIRYEQLHKTGDPPVDPEAGVKAFSVFTQVAQDVTNDTLLQPEAQIYNWQAARGQKQRNMIPIHVGNTRETNSVAQMASDGGSFKTKSFFNVTDLKDNYDDLAGQYVGTTTFTAPNDQAYLRIAMVDRLPTIPHASNYIMPDMLIRVKIKFKCMLSHPNSTFNRDQIGT